MYAKAGAMVAYRGDVRFSRKGTLEDGVGKFLKKAVTGDGMRLLKMDIIHAILLLGTLVGRTSGESIRMRFKGDGGVMAQPCEEGAAVARW